MPDFVVHRNPSETAAVHACRYVLTRVCRDANYAYYMLHTGAMEACIAGLCEATGENPDEVKASILRAWKDLPQPDVKQLREECRRLESRLDDQAGREEPEPKGLSADQIALTKIEAHLWYSYLRNESPDRKTLERIVRERYGVVA